MTPTSARAAGSPGSLTHDPVLLSEMAIAPGRQAGFPDRQPVRRDQGRPPARAGVVRCQPGSGGTVLPRLAAGRPRCSDRRLPQGRGIDEGPRLMTGRGTAHDRKAPAHGRKGQDHASGGPASIWLLASPRLDRVNWSTALRSELRPGLARHQAGVVALDGLLVWGLAVAHSLSGDQEASRPWR